MKLTKKRLVFFLLHALFSAILPIVLVIVQYSNIGNTKAAVGFKIGITGILLLLFLFWIVKKLFIDRKLSDLKAQSNVMLADLRTKQDEAELKALEREIRLMRTTEAVLNSIMPILFLITALTAFKALEAQLVKLSGTLGWITISFCVGVVFDVLYSREVFAKRKGDVDEYR